MQQPSYSELRAGSREEPGNELQQLKAANWHLFREGGLFLLFDARTLSLHLLDEVTWEVVQAYGYHEDQKVVSCLAGRFPRRDVASSLRELEGLISQGVILDFRKRDQEVLPGELIPGQKPLLPTKALCLNVAHDCNLRCRYCFAGSGDFGGGRKLMTHEVARRSLDFLFDVSGPKKHCEVDFFGGEPLINWQVVQDTVLYGTKMASALSKSIKFTVTTNATLLDDEKIGFITQHNMDIVLSLDGRPKVNDRMRTFADGRPTYGIVSKNIQRYLRRKGSEAYYVRGTYTRHNMDFTDDVMHLADLGAKSVSVEPVVASTGDPYSLRQEDLPEVFQEYGRLARSFIERTRSGNGFSFFHFNLDLDRGPCVAKRFSGCGAGIEYLAVTPDGDIYPCHQFVGRPDFLMGTVWQGIVNNSIARMFSEAHIYTKKGCSSCWARFLCGGGCHAGAFASNHSILHPDGISCALMRRRLECALFVKAALAAQC